MTGAIVASNAVVYDDGVLRITRVEPLVVAFPVPVLADGQLEATTRNQGSRDGRTATMAELQQPGHRRSERGGTARQNPVTERRLRSRPARA